MFIQELHPSSIIIASNSQEQLKIALEKNLSGVEYRVISVASGMFSEECARRYISMLRAGNVPATSSRPLLVGAASLSLVFDFSKQQVTKAVGALLSYLHKNPIIGAEVNLNEGTIIVESFSQIDLSKIVTMDGSAFSALQIFQTERHPSMHGIGIQKEGMSLFSLMDNTSSQPGAKMLKQWFHRPICDKACINNRLNTIEFFLKSLGPEVMRDLSVIISQVKPLNHILLSLKKGSNTMNQYESLLKTILNCCAAIETLSSFTLYDPSLTKKYPILDDVASFPTSTLNELANRIFGTIDFDGKMEPSSENKQQNEVFESDNNEVFSDSNSSNSLTQEKRTKLSRNPETDEEMENESFGRINDRKTQSGLFHDDFEKRSNLLDAYSSQSSIFGPLHKKRFQESVFHPYRITSPLLIPFGDDDDDNSYFSDFDNEVKPFESFGNTKTAFISEGMQSFDAYRSFPFKDKERNFRENKEILDKSNVKNKLDTQKIKELKKQNIISSKRKKGIIMKDEQSGNEKVKANENDEIMEDDNYPKGNEFQSKEVAVPKGDEARVRRGINSTLDRLKETYSSLADLMSNVAKEEIESMPKGLIHRLSVAFFPNLGYLIAIHLKEFSGFEDIQTEHLSQEEDYTRTTFQLSQSRRDELALIEKQCGLTYQFEIDATRYYKSRRMKEMDLTLGDITEQIADEERKVFTDLKLKIDDCTDILIKAVDIIAEVDCYISFAVSAYEYHLTRPQIVDEPELTISEGRNLLQELCVPFFVPNDTHLKGDKPEAILLITGPNSSGKTVYLKQVAQIVFLAHIGSFVPAKAATIGLVDHIFCRIVTTESVSTPLSSFMIDSMQMSTMMQNASRHSLLLIDEYGKGTNHIGLQNEKYAYEEFERVE
ncbi:putative DNA mismatch repair protein MSH5 [Monocercomonoides exilis]|uniref:putative DNA mismatch repair protein MSH5 n=1 Tax=Monocercomonoides exilis TaxID=2049356 RepID=UPI00355995C9|nr:putative DNA mismatch repair protein MSH5 [Monocercomonoides exilis]|eukprot:MONOS_11244.1-p1 / transcript=MONOS_11244.1 / gene=MONOS_11244 / organism=Monocercomonoides_exilis_PA203 / gene_product=DNA mismatch repair protein MSH5 / transcript_product=DNA mismatch repair protein MSH5 / location=Mono_scaffold00553:38691-42497(+) / protein_length=886 / sequence_SO=supercontig / SO=protein_coding / is_pseudo=false